MDVRRLYRTVREDVRDTEGAGPTPPVDIDTATPTASLGLPLELWESGAKPSRAAAGLLVTDPHLSQSERRLVEPILVGLDVLIAMLDESIDTRAGSDHGRLDLAVNIAFGSLLSFSTIPDRLTEPVVDQLQRYFVTVAKIPVVEHRVQKRLATVESPAAGMDLVRSCYAYRAWDISAFGQIPALVAGLGDDTAGRLVSDLRAYRARYLLFDDVRDVQEDVEHGTETPVVWLLRTCDSPAAVERRLFEIYRTFTYVDTDRGALLGGLEREPPTLSEDLEALYGRV